MRDRNPNEAATDGEHGSYDSLLSPCETYEGSRHYAVSLDLEDDVDLDLEDLDLEDLEIEDLEILIERPLPRDEDGGARATKETVVMSAALLARLRAQLVEEAANEPNDTRPTQRSMPAVRLEEQGRAPEGLVAARHRAS